MRRLSCFLTLASFACLLASPEVRAQDSDAAFQGFLDALQTSRELVLSRTSEDGTDRAEGLRHIIRLIEMQNAPTTDDHDVANPHVSRCPSVVCKVGFDNPDFTYINVAPISAEYTYRILRQAGDGAVHQHAGLRQSLGGEGVHDFGRPDRGASTGATRSF